MKTKTSISFAILALASVGSAMAQSVPVRAAYSFPSDDKRTGPSSMQLGSSPIFFTPYVGAAYGHDDNIFLRPTNKISSDLLVLSPSLGFDARNANSFFKVSYDAQFGRYSQSRDDDYNDQVVRAQYDIAFDRRNFLKLGMDYIRGHEPRGSTDRPFGSGPDKYRLTTPNATYAFGAPGAQGRVEVYGGQAKRDYLNNSEFTAFSDRKNTEFGGAFFWRAMPKTYVLFEARDTDIKYKNASPFNFSATERRYYGGVTWDATAATSGTVKLGRLERRFDQDVPKVSATSWEAAVTWAPLTYSKVDLFTSRLTNESTGLGTFILSSVTGVTWSHAWSAFITTAADFRYLKDDYQGVDRHDETKALGLKVGYKFRRWLTVGAEYNHSKRDSNLPAFDYDKNLYLLTATASM